MENESIKAGSIPEEREIIERTPCKNCGGKLKKSTQALLIAEKIDLITAVCEECGQKTEFRFDISSFLG